MIKVTESLSEKSLEQAIVDIEKLKGDREAIFKTKYTHESYSLGPLEFATEELRDDHND